MNKELIILSLTYLTLAFCVSYFFIFFFKNFIQDEETKKQNVLLTSEESKVDFSYFKACIIYYEIFYALLSIFGLKEKRNSLIAKSKKFKGSLNYGANVASESFYRFFCFSFVYETSIDFNHIIYQTSFVFLKIRFPFMKEEKIFNLLKKSFYSEKKIIKSEDGKKRILTFILNFKRPS